MTPASFNPRASAARAIAAVMRGRALDDALHHKADGFTRALAYGVLREHRRLDYVLMQLLTPGTAVDTEVHALLLAGLFQLQRMDVAPYAAVNETVDATTALNKPKARGLVNAVMRRYQRERAELDARESADLAVRQSYPDWMVRQIQQDWPQQGEKILEAGNVQAPMTLRINVRKTSVAEYQKELLAAGIEAQTIPAAPQALRLARACNVEELPGFNEGTCSVQDAAAQLAAPLLQLQPGLRVLDACAAPGGKTAQVLEQADVNLTAVDNDPARLARVQHNLDRLSLKANLALSDVADTARWWDGQPFDRILLDAPCTGTGVIRRHPDIKWLRRDTDVEQTLRQQQRLLHHLWPLLAPGGVLLYATCSILQAEGDDVISYFLKPRRDVRVDPIHARWGEATQHGRRIAPGGDFDGFYYARLVKKAG